jgi:DNA adenine methylase
MGSKARFAKELLPVILKDRKDGQWYVEPFAGGMNIIANVDGNRLANDIHPYLIAMWKALVSGWIPPEYVSREHWHEVKKNKEVYPDYYVGWVGFNCSYSGKWFDAYAGKTKTKNGNIRDYQFESKKNVSKQTPNMIGVVFSNSSYSNFEIPENSIVYCDPPYKNVRGYKDKIDHDDFWDWVRKLVKQGHTVFVSEYAAPDDFECIWQKNTKSSISANGVTGGSRSSVEKLFIKGELQ